MNLYMLKYKQTEMERPALPYVIYSIQFICIAYFSKFDKYNHLTETNIEILKWINNIINNIKAYYKNGGVIFSHRR